MVLPVPTLSDRDLQEQKGPPNGNKDTESLITSLQHWLPGKGMCDLVPPVREEQRILSGKHSHLCVQAPGGNGACVSLC